MAFCLDIDGTLVLTDDLYFRAFQRLLAPYGIEVDEPFYKQHIHGRAECGACPRLPTYEASNGRSAGGVSSVVSCSD